MKKKLLLYLLLLSWQFLLAQTDATKDSLLNVLASTKEDTNKVLLLINIGQHLGYNSPEEAKNYYRQAKALSEKLGYQMGVLRYYGRYTEVLNFQGRFDSSLLLNQQALVIAEKYGNKERIAMTQHNIAGSYSFLDEYENALEWELKALPVIESGGDSAKMGIIYDAIGLIYLNIRSAGKALEYHQKALAIWRNDKDDIGAAISLSNIGNAYSRMNRYAEALTAYKESLAFSRKHNAESIQEKALSNIANIYFKKGIYDSIKEYAEQALEISKRLDDSVSIALTQYQLAVHYFFRKDFDKSRVLAMDGFGIAQRNNYKNSYQLHANILSELALVKADLKMYGYYDRLSDSLQEEYFNETAQKNVQVLDKKYETEKKEKQLIIQQAIINKKNTLNYIFIGSTAALLIISLLSYRNYRHKRKLQQQKIAELEKEKLLSATQSILKGQEEERSRLAKDLHDGLGGLLSGVKLQLGAMKGNLILSEEHGHTFNNALVKLDESISEMRRVAHNMMPEALMKLGLQQALQDYCDGLSESQPFAINCEFHGLEKRMEPSTEVVLYRIVQELLNNAVKHSGATTILAQVMRHNNHISITVEDNGKGFDKDIVLQGPGLQTIRSRVNYLKGQLDVQSAHGRGTSVHIDCTIDNNG
ncbi:MAG: sensor histidine kinase [Ferruginibacter sp.]